MRAMKRENTFQRARFDGSQRQRGGWRGLERASGWLATGLCSLVGWWVMLSLTPVAAASPPARARVAWVLHVSDGDTLWVQSDHDGEALKLRLAGIDAPELCQPWGQQAWRALQARLQGQRVQVVTGRLDSYGRWLAQVWHQGQDVGGWMVAQGHAWSPHYKGLPGPYDEWQRRAQWLRLGLFAHPLGLMPPREFRRWHGAC